MLKKNNVLFFILSILLSILVVFSCVSPISVSADSSVPKIENTNVLDDLQDMTIDGKKFSLEDYNFDTNKNTQILSFVEYCYSFYKDKQNNFGLYLYVYNPKGINFDTDSSLNTIQFSITKEFDSYFYKYKLKFINKSEKLNYEGLFYKFKIVLSSVEKTFILNNLNPSLRIYNVSGFELLRKGAINAIDYPTSLIYKFSGYAKGYGTNDNSISTLTSTTEETETLPLSVHSTVYRPEYTNGKDAYTRDSLHSVYFAVPNEYIERYGAMSAVHATWLNAVLKPALVTGNQEAFNSFQNYLGKDVTSLSSSVFPYSYCSNSSLLRNDYGSDILQCDYYYGYLGSESWGSYDFYNLDLAPREVLPSLYLLFNSGSENESAKNHVVSSEEIKSKLIESSSMFGGNLVNGKYSPYIFESVDKEFTDKIIYADDLFSLTSIKISQSWWESLLGFRGSETTDYSSAFDNLSAIYAVQDSDLLGLDSDISKRLCVSLSDINAFKDFYDLSKKNNSTVYLFRYYLSDYVAHNATLYTESKSLLGVSEAKEVDSNAYFFQETINLDFDIIDVSFSTGEVTTIIPVVSNPIDVVGPGEPPIDSKPDEKGCTKEDFKMILGLIALVFILWLLTKIGILPFIGKIIVWIITAPFKFIKWLIGKFRGD